MQAGGQEFDPPHLHQKGNLLVIANYRKDDGVPYMKTNYPNTEVHAFGMHMMFHEYADQFNTVLRDFLKQKVGKS